LRGAVDGLRTVSGRDASVGAVRIDSILLTADLVGDALEHLNVVSFDAVQDLAAQLSGDGVVFKHWESS